jgi:hypothetical protein
MAGEVLLQNCRQKKSVIILVMIALIVLSCITTRIEISQIKTRSTDIYTDFSVDHDLFLVSFNKVDFTFFFKKIERSFPKFILLIYFVLQDVNQKIIYYSCFIFLLITIMLFAIFYQISRTSSETGLLVISNFSNFVSKLA